MQPLVPAAAQPPGDVGIFGRVVRDLRERHFVHPLLVLARADQLVDLDRRVVADSAAPARRDCDCARRRRAGSWRPWCRSARRRRSRRHVRSTIMSYFRFWPILSMAGFSSTGASASSVAAGSSCGSPGGRPHRHVVGLAILPGERIADDLGPPRPDARRFGVERESPACRDISLDQPRQPLGRVDQLGSRRPTRFVGLRSGSAANFCREAVKAQLGEQLDQRLAVRRRSTRAASQSIVDRHVAIEPHQLAAQAAPARAW